MIQLLLLVHTIYCNDQLVGWYGVRGAEVDHSCFNDPVKWIKSMYPNPPQEILQRRFEDYCK